MSAPLTDAQVDRMLSAPIPGGSAARDWFLPHDYPQGLRNVRDVVRAMAAAAPVQAAELTQGAIPARLSVQRLLSMYDECGGDWCKVARAVEDHCLAASTQGVRP